MQIPQPLSDVLAPLFEALPLDNAMPELVPTRKADSQIVEIAEAVIRTPIVQANLGIQAAVWLYVDELDRSHQASQSLESPIGSLWHGVMHRREGDFWNSKYWFRKAGTVAGFDGMNPAAFVDRVEQTYKNNPDELLAQQRQEWVALLELTAQGATR